MLFCLKGLATHQVWRTGVLAFAFWAINVGLALMVLLSLLPVGLLQTWASVEHGTWYARSAEFMQTPTMHTLRWMRIVGDTIFAAGMVALGWFVLGLKTGWSIAGSPDAVAREYPEEADRGPVSQGRRGLAHRVRPVSPHGSSPPCDRRRGSSAGC